mgnify:CR=1 FL=1
MNKIKSFGTILGIWAVGLVISLLIKSMVSIPGSIIGMLLLFVLLKTGIIKLTLINETADFFLQHITLFILPFGIAFVKYWEVIKENFMVMILCGVVSTIISFVFTMKFVDLLVAISKKRKEKTAHE